MSPRYEEITHKVGDAKVYSKAKSRNSLGQYNWKCVITACYIQYIIWPMQISLTTIWSKNVIICVKLEKILEQCPRTICIHNDVAICGKDYEDHNQNLIN